jgi:hypothetical protein
MGAASILLLVIIGIAWLSPVLTTRHEVLQSILSKALANVFNDTSLGKASQATNWPFSVSIASRTSLPTDKSYVSTPLYSHNACTALTRVLFSGRGSLLQPAKQGGPYACGLLWHVQRQRTVPEQRADKQREACVLHWGQWVRRARCEYGRQQSAAACAATAHHLAGAAEGHGVPPAVGAAGG